MEGKALVDAVIFTVGSCVVPSLTVATAKFDDHAIDGNAFFREGVVRQKPFVGEHVQSLLIGKLCRNQICERRNVLFEFLNVIVASLVLRSVLTALEGILIFAALVDVAFALQLQLAQFADQAIA